MHIIHLVACIVPLWFTVIVRSSTEAHTCQIVYCLFTYVTAASIMMDETDQTPRKPSAGY